MDVLHILLSLGKTTRKKALSLANSTEYQLVARNIVFNNKFITHNPKMNMKLKGCSTTLADAMLAKNYSDSYNNHPWRESRDKNKTGYLRAHHLIPYETVSNKDWTDYREEFQYDINEYKNGIFLPTMTDTACQLGVAVHRGPHNRGLNYESALDYMESGVPIPDDIDLTLHTGGLTYIRKIKHQLKEIEIRLKKGTYCGTGGKAKFKEEMREVAREATSQINSFQWTISRWGKDYRKKDLTGCANCETEGKNKKRELCSKRIDSPTFYGQHKLTNIKGEVMRKIKPLKVGY